MDGNRRYAKSKGHIGIWGHKQGYETLKDFLDWSKDLKIETVIAYCFSSENWNRSKSEVSLILSLFRSGLEEILNEKNIGKVIFIGDRNRFPKDIVERMEKVEEKTKRNKGVTAVLALSYGGRDEIVRAAQRVVRDGVTISETNFSNYLDTKDIRDPDMIIRTGEEMRLSNFLLWQSAYSELFFTKTFWPAFTRVEFESMLQEYAKRKRNFGV